jgi:pyruvate dehydrogenase E1 component
VDAKFITLATLAALHREGKMESGVIRQAMLDLGIDPEKTNPLFA